MSSSISSMELSAWTTRNARSSVRPFALSSTLTRLPDATSVKPSLMIWSGFSHKTTQCSCSTRRVHPGVFQAFCLTVASTLASIVGLRATTSPLTRTVTRSEARTGARTAIRMTPRSSSRQTWEPIRTSSGRPHSIPQYNLTSGSPSTVRQNSNARVSSSKSKSHGSRHASSTTTPEDPVNTPRIPNVHIKHTKNIHPISHSTFGPSPPHSSFQNNKTTTITMKNKKQKRKHHQGNGFADHNGSFDIHQRI
mmetsp:Transcript_6851/g.14088  ORF Transcript_6851/g.14088 Transcript_6851/m.14088 type:complete len:251 (+) Transcript_6851:1603-2355(+)